MKWRAFKQGIDILDKYVIIDNYCVHAEHDQIWVGVEMGTLTPVDRDALLALGWFYEPLSESWTCFT